LTVLLMLIYNGRPSRKKQPKGWCAVASRRRFVVLAPILALLLLACAPADPGVTPAPPVDTPPAALAEFHALAGGAEPK
jgi:hypothetical protein